LNDEWMWATPDPTFLNSRFLRVFVCFFAAKRQLLSGIYLAGHGPVSSPRPAGLAVRALRPDSVRSAKAVGHTKARVSRLRDNVQLYHETGSGARLCAERPPKGPRLRRGGG
jgi:hypothetical protein